MAEEIILPKWGLTMEEGTVRAWTKQEGDPVAVDEVIGEACFRDLKAPVVRVTGLDTPIPFSLVLEKYILPGKEQVINGIHAAMKLE